MRVTNQNDPLKFVIEATLFISAFVFFSIQIKDVIGKYFDGRTTISMRQEVPEKLEWPTFIFHFGSGLKNSYEASHQAYLLSSQPWNGTIKNHPYYQAIYKLGRDFNITAANTILRLGTNIVRDGFLGYQQSDVKVEQVASHSDGLFYAIQFKDLENNIYKPSFTIDLSNVTTAIQVYIMDHGDRYRVVDKRHWKGMSPYIFEPQIGSSMSISLSKSIHKYLTVKGTKEKCKIYSNGESKDTCYWQEVAEKTIETMIQNCTNVCATPPYVSILSLASPKLIELCATQEEVDCLSKVYWTTYQLINKKKTCSKSCLKSAYHGSSRIIDKFIDKESAYFEVEYDMDTIDVYEELYLFDTSTFIGNVGGSLGLFIGFSYFQFAKMMAFSIVERTKRIGKTL